MLSEADCLDLRKRVLMGEELSLEEAQQVFEKLRQAQGGAVIAAEDRKKTGRKPSKPGISDEQLDADLNDLGL